MSATALQAWPRSGGKGAHDGDRVDPDVGRRWRRWCLRCCLLSNVGHGCWMENRRSMGLGRRAGEGRGGGVQQGRAGEPSFVPPL